MSDLNLEQLADKYGVTDFIEKNGGEQPLSNFTKWQAAHYAMIAAFEIKDFDCAAQDCKEAREFSNGALDEYYDIMLDHIIERLKNP